MTTALATTSVGDFTPQSITEAQSLAIELAKSMLVPKDFKGKPADVFAAITYGAELGLAPWAAMQSLIVIHGRVTMYADAMVALVLASSDCEYFRCVDSSSTSVTYETLRKGSSPTKYTFTAEDAKRAGLNNDNYRKFPQRMLGARAKSFLARDVYPDILRGLHSTEEVIDIEPSQYVETENFSPASEEPTVEAEVAEEAPTPSAVDRILSATSLEELEAVAATLKGLSGEEREKAKAAYSQHRATLERAGQ